MARKKGRTTQPISAPTGGELDVLTVLWAAKRPLKFGEIYKSVCEMRRSFGEPVPANSTIGSFLRRLAEKELIDELLPVGGLGEGRASLRVRGGMLGAKSRSPNLTYQPAHDPRDVLASTYKALIESYPPDRRKRLEPLADFAEVLGLSTKAIKQIGKIAADDEASRK